MFSVDDLENVIPKKQKIKKKKEGEERKPILDIKVFRHRIRLRQAGDL